MANLLIMRFIISFSRTNCEAKYSVN